MLWTKEKLAARMKEIEPYRYRDEQTVTGMKMLVDETGAVGASPPHAGVWSDVRIGDRWTGQDLYVWLAFEWTVPAGWMGKTALGRFDFGRTGAGNNSGFESLLYLNGFPYQGVDSNHEEVFLPKTAPGSTLQFQFRLWSGLNGYGKAAPIESRISRASVCWLDEATDDLYYTARAALETAELLGDNDPDHHALLAALDRAFLRIDWSEPGSDAFYRSVDAARDVLRSQLDAMPKRHPVTVQCIGHTHIDVAWLWRLKHTREKSARSFSTVLRLMERYPEYIFLQTQPQLYDYLKHDYPDIYEQIRTRVAEGRWEAGGAMWLEADCNLASGESLVRQLLYGTRFFRDEFGVECRYLWLPDVFGYSWALPQILRKSGIDMFMTTKISWNQYNRMPHDTFRWRGIDGSEVLTHFITTPDPGGREGVFYYTYNGSVSPESVRGIWEGYRDKEINQHLLLSYGYGDGGGGVNREMLEMRRRLEDMPGVPRVIPGRADEYFEGLKERIANTDRYVHTWDGELYLELHRGTYTSQAYNKRANRKLELLYREAEWMNVLALASMQPAGKADWSRYPKASLDEGWTIILRNQFHDIIPGSSIGEVYEDSRIEYTRAFELGDDACRQAAGRLTEAAPEREHCEYTVWNGASWTRKGVVFVEVAEESGRWLDADGRPLSVQRSGAGWLVEVCGVPPLGYAPIRFVPDADDGAAAQEPIPFQLTPSGVTTPFYELEWNEKGQLVKLYDKQFRRSVLTAGALGNVFQVFEDKPKGRHEAWDIDIFYQEKMRVVDSLENVAVEELGPLRVVIGMTWTYRNSVIWQRMVLYAADRRIDFEAKVDWHERRQLLKVAFPVQIRASEATYDIQFGNVKRPTHWNTSWDYARFETVGHQWADLSERNYGVSLLNDCKYGYDIKDNVMRLSLIKSAMVPDPNADQGSHVFTYSLLPHGGDWYEARTVQSAWDLNRPLHASAGKPKGAARLSLFALTGGNAMIDAVKRAEEDDSVVVRLHEFAGMRGEMSLLSDLPVQRWQETDLMERPIGRDREGVPIAFELNPYEIKTFIVKLKS